jgi:hypothetical protein
MDKEFIKKILKESTGKYTRIAIFDFDGTLVDTPTPNTGVKEYKEITGQEWPHKGWWGRAESLDMTIFDMPVIPEAIRGYNEQRSIEDTLMVMMTGRIKKLAPEVEKILNYYNLVFDEYLYNTGGPTLSTKLNYLDLLIDKNPTTKYVHMYEDRNEHIGPFKAWGSTKEIEFKITEIKSGHHD